MQRGGCNEKRQPMNLGISSKPFHDFGVTRRRIRRPVVATEAFRYKTVHGHCIALAQLPHVDLLNVDNVSRVYLIDFAFPPLGALSREQKQSNRRCVTVNRTKLLQYRCGEGAALFRIVENQESAQNGVGICDRLIQLDKMSVPHLSAQRLGNLGGEAGLRPSRPAP